KQSGENPFAGIRGTLFGGFCLLAGAVLAAAEALLARLPAADAVATPPLWPVWGLLFVVGLLAALNPRRR
ncbi:MAG: hypothetical protein AAGD38_08835, partial [Acidobacteriota bacterium]